MNKCCKKDNLCSITEEVKPTPAETIAKALGIQEEGHTNIVIRVRNETLARLQDLIPEQPVKQTIEEFVETLDW